MREEPTCLRFREGRWFLDETSVTSGNSAGVVATACMKGEIERNPGSPVTLPPKTGPS